MGRVLLKKFGKVDIQFEIKIYIFDKLRVFIVHSFVEFITVLHDKLGNLLVKSAKPLVIMLSDHIINEN